MIKTKLNKNRDFQNSFLSYDFFKLLFFLILFSILAIPLFYISMKKFFNGLIALLIVVGLIGGFIWYAYISKKDKDGSQATFNNQVKVDTNVVFPSKRGSVNDFADILNTTQKKQLQKIAEQYEQKTGIELTFVTSLGVGDSKANPQTNYLKQNPNQALASAWDLGNQYKDNWAVLMLRLPYGRNKNAKANLQFQTSYGVQIRFGSRPKVSDIGVYLYENKNYAQSLLTMAEAINRFDKNVFQARYEEPLSIHLKRLQVVGYSRLATMTLKKNHVQRIYMAHMLLEKFPEKDLEPYPFVRELYLWGNKFSEAEKARIKKLYPEAILHY